MKITLDLPDWALLCIFFNAIDSEFIDQRSDRLRETLGPDAQPVLEMLRRYKALTDHLSFQIAESHTIVAAQILTTAQESIHTGKCSWTINPIDTPARELAFEEMQIFLRDLLAKTATIPNEIPKTH